MFPNPTRILREAATLITLMAFGPGSILAAPADRVEVRGQGTDLGETPVIIPLKTKLAAGSYFLRSGTSEDRRELPANVFGDGDKTYLGIILDRVAKDEKTTFELVKLDGAGPRAKLSDGSRPLPKQDMPGIDFEPKGRNLRVLIGDQLFTEYISSSTAPKPFYYPVIGPTGAPFTRAFPMAKVAGEAHDHPHQRSFWFTHGKVKDIDFWSEDGKNGRIQETDRKSLVEGMAVGLIRTTDDWLSPDGHKVCEDERVVKFYATRSIRVIDFDITLKATNGPVTFGDTKEGMFGLRVASSMDVDRKQGGKITNAEGLHDADAWGKPSAWVDYIGPVEGKTVGIAVLNHPSSFRYPTTWHVRTYGLFAANPFGWHDFGRPERGDYTIEEGQSIAFRYRVILHEGDTPSARLPAAFEAYAHPPEVEVLAD
jgi:hypothetical protein